jgi:superfamily I DNA and RNA helicase
MIYVLDAQYADEGPNLITRRNTLFTAMTRSRAWLRVCAWGSETPVADEIRAVQMRAFRLEFTIPTATGLADLRRIHRDRSDEELATVKRATRSVSELLDAVERGELDVQDLPASLRTRLLRLVRDEIDDGTD